MKISIRHHLSIGLGSGTGTAHGVQHLLLTPRSGATQTVIEWAIEMPGFAAAESFTDAYGNLAQLVCQGRPEGELTIAVAGLVETFDRHGVVGKPADEPVPALFRRQTALTRPIGAITSKFRSAPQAGKERIALLHGLMMRVGEVLGEAEQTQTQDGQSQSQSQGGARATASEYAHGFIGAARSLEIPARYVTGYLAGSEEQPAAFHAWAEAWDDGLGWIGFDAMLGYCPTDLHVRLAAGLDALSTVPVRSIPAVGTPQLLGLSVEAVG